jgi:hypothetical protein
MEKEIIKQTFQEIKLHALNAISEHTLEDYTQEEIDFNEQHWRGVIIGAETLMKKLFGESPNYFNFDN